MTATSSRRAISLLVAAAIILALVFAYALGTRNGETTLDLNEGQRAAASSGPAVPPGRTGGHEILAGALAWAQDQEGDTSFSGWCLRFVANAYKNATAIYNSPVQMISELDVNDEPPADAPPGSLLLFRADPSNDNFGHVGLSLGDGRMISATWDAVEYDDVSDPYWADLYAGWILPPAEWSPVIEEPAPSTTATTLQGSSPILQGGSPAPTTPTTLQGSDHQVQGPQDGGGGGAAPTTTAPASTTTTTPTTSTAAPAPTTYRETCASPSGRGCPTFSNYENASGEGVRIAQGAEVEITCKLLPERTVESAKPDGYWYKVASSPWNNEFWAVANSFHNGGDGRSATNHSIPDC